MLKGGLKGGGTLRGGTGDLKGGLRGGDLKGGKGRGL